jgi:citrate lyase subunit beta/citryl-CoA lyase
MPQSRIGPIRSLLSIPGHDERLLGKGAAAPADACMLDLEDAVPPAQKLAARGRVRDCLTAGAFAGRRVFARLNEFESGLTAGDVAGVACRELTGFVYPMTHTPAEIQALDVLLAASEAALGLDVGHFVIVPLIETASGVLLAGQIATASSRVAALIFGGEDYLAEIGGRHDPAGLCFHTPRVQVILAARSAGIEPLDTPYVDVRDEAGLLRHAESGRALGMAGMLALSPRQLPTIHLVYSPTEEELRAAQDVLRELEELRAAGHGLTVREGRYISPVAERKARALLARAAALDKQGG